MNSRLSLPNLLASTCRKSEKVAIVLALGFGAGLAPFTPGTFGTLVAIPFVWALWQSGPWIHMTVALMAFAAGIWICDRGAKALNKPDPGAVVWDEMVGLWLALWGAEPDVFSLVAGFLLFRLFDGLKPWPVSWADRSFKGGFGIMFDDALAAVYTAATLGFVRHMAGFTSFLQP